MHPGHCVRPALRFPERPDLASPARRDLACLALPAREFPAPPTMPKIDTQIAELDKALANQIGDIGKLLADLNKLYGDIPKAPSGRPARL